MTQHPIDQRDVWSRLSESMAKLANVEAHRLTPEQRAERLAARSQQLRAVAQIGPGEASLAILCFNKGGIRFGVPVSQVIEAAPLDHFTEVPGTPPFIIGVLHWRGEVLTLFDLPALLNISESGISDMHVCLIIQAAGKRIAIPALEVEDIVATPLSELKAVPNAAGSIPPEWVRGVIQENRLIVTLETILQDSHLTNWRQG